MKVKLIILIVGLLPLFSSAKTIHWITVSDVEDSHIGNMNVNGINALVNHLIYPIANVATSLGYDNLFYKIEKADFKPQSIIATIKGLESDKDDIFFLYYVGHGVASSKETEFPLLVLSPDTDGVVDFVDLNKILQEKNHKAIVSIAVASNMETSLSNLNQSISNSETVTTRISPIRLDVQEQMTLTSSEFSNIEQGIKSLRGELFICSAQKGYTSVGGNTPLGPMDLFTCVLIKNFEGHVSDRKLNWVELLDDTTAVVESLSERRQIPYYELKISNKQQ